MTMNKTYYTSIQGFNKAHNIEINSKAEFDEIFDEIHKTPYRCGFIALNKDDAKKAVLQEESIINLEDKLYLCVR